MNSFFSFSTFWTGENFDFIVLLSREVLLGNRWETQDFYILVVVLLCAEDVSSVYSNVLESWNAKCEKLERWISTDVTLSVKFFEKRGNILIKAA